MFTFCEVVTNVTVGRIGTYDGHVICVCFTNVHDHFETPLKLFVPILCKHCESTIVAVGGIRVKYKILHLKLKTVTRTESPVFFCLQKLLFLSPGKLPVGHGAARAEGEDEMNQ